MASSNGSNDSNDDREDDDAEVTLRPLRADEVESAARFWALDMGFDVGVNLFNRWFRVDPDAFWVAVIGDRIVGTASATRQTDSLYFVGTVGVAKSHRGRGLVRRLLSNLYSRCPDANFGLSAVPDCLSMYTRMGYVPVEDTYAYIYVGRLDRDLVGVTTATEKVTGTEEAENPVRLLEVVSGDGRDTETDFLAYDERVHGFVRDVRLTLLNDPSGLVLEARRAGKLVGFGKVQRNLRDGGAWFGPLYADDIGVARRIFDELLSRFETEARISIYVILSEQARDIAESLLLRCIEKSPRCYLRPDAESLPPMDLSKLFAFDSLDFCLI